MRSKKQTRKLIEFCRARFDSEQIPVSLTEFTAQAELRKLRTSAALLDKIRSVLRTNEMNELLRILSGEIRDRAVMMLLYDVLDRIAKTSLRTESGKRIRQKGKRLGLEERFRRENPDRYKKVIQALEQEALVRELPGEQQIWPDHCHIWKNFFSYSTEGKLKKMLRMDEESFGAKVYCFLAELAATAGEKRTRNRFDWQRFSWSGFSREDLDSLFNPRNKHLEILELPPDADNREIRIQYKKLARKHHPDRGGDTRTMARINLAYSALTRDREQLL